MARKKSSPAEDFLEIVAMLPWWAGVTLALVSYLLLHAYASSPAPATPTQVGQLGSFVIQQILKTLAFIGQYLVPFLCLCGALISAISRAKRQRLHADIANSSSATALNDMSWQEFEMLVGEAFRRQGFAVSETGGGADGGADLVLNKDKERFLVQCKQWRAMKVGVGVVRELYGVMAAQGATGGYVITSGLFSQEARDFASGRNVQLLDGKALYALIADVPRASVAPVAAPEDAPPCCPKCASRMVKRVAKQGASAGKPFWGCSHFPVCRGARGI